MPYFCLHSSFSWYESIDLLFHTPIFLSSTFASLLDNHLKSNKTTHPTNWYVVVSAYSWSKFEYWSMIRSNYTSQYANAYQYTANLVTGKDLHPDCFPPENSVWLYLCTTFLIGRQKVVDKEPQMKKTKMLLRVYKLCHPEVLKLYDLEMFV